MFWLLGVPAMALTGVNTYYAERKHMHHLEEHPHVPAPYDYLRVRTKVCAAGETRAPR